MHKHVKIISYKCWLLRLCRCSDRLIFYLPVHIYSFQYNQNFKSLSRLCYSTKQSYDIALYYNSTDKKEYLNDINCDEHEQSGFKYDDMEDNIYKCNNIKVDNVEHDDCKYKQIINVEKDNDQIEHDELKNTDIDINESTNVYHNFSDSDTSSDHLVIDLKTESSNGSKTPVKIVMKTNKQKDLNKIIDKKPSQRRCYLDDKFSIKKMNEEEMLKAREVDKSMSWYLSSQYKCETCILGYRKKDKYDKHINTKHNKVSILATAIALPLLLME